MLRIQRIGAILSVTLLVALVILNVICYMKKSSGCTKWYNCTFVDVDDGYCYTATAY